MASGAAASSRKKKKLADVHRGRRKNSNKSLKRRRVSSSPSTYFCDSEDDSRNRRRRGDSGLKLQKRRGRDKRRSENNSSRRFRRRNVSSSCDSSSSCSTCRNRSSDSLERSRSPVRHREFRKGKWKIKSRGRKLDRGRRMSRSCSTCRGSSSRSLRSGRRRRRREKGDMGQKEKRREKGGLGLSRSFAMDTSGDIEGRNGSEGKETNNQMCNENYDYLLAARGNVEHNVDKVEQDEMMDPGYYDQATETDRWMDEGKVEKDYYFGQFEDDALGRREPHSSEPYQFGKSCFEDSDGSHTYDFRFNSETRRKIKSEVVVVDKIGSESDDLESLLRQKALENLKKLREVQSVDNKSPGNRKNDSGGDECSEKPSTIFKNSIASSEPYSIVSERDILEGFPMCDPKVSHFIEHSANKANDDYNPDKHIGCSSLSTSGCSKQLDKDIIMVPSASVGPNSGRDFPEKVSCKQPPNGDSQEKASAAVECGASVRLNEGGQIHGSHENVDVDEKNHGKKENLDESGSQYEQKTFSRMHDGEMVQVSYKVYIPKKHSALARRKLQR